MKSKKFVASKDKIMQYLGSEIITPGIENDINELQKEEAENRCLVEKSEIISAIHDKLDEFDEQTLVDIWRDISNRQSKPSKAPHVDQSSPEASNSVQNPFNEFPTKAPALWAERTTGREVTPVDFIKKHYAAFVSEDLPPIQRLPRKLLGRLDDKLLAAYAVWIKRHPQDDLGLPTRKELVEHELSLWDDEALLKASQLRSSAYRRKNRL